MLYYFNPGHEYALVNASPYYMASTNMIKMQTDLAYLSAWYANVDDSILVIENLPKEFVSLLLSNNLQLPKGVTQQQLISSGNRRSKVHCWGISPQAKNYIETINKKYHLSLDIPHWNDKIKELSSRVFSRDCLLYLIKSNKLIEENIVPQYYKSLEELKPVVLSCDYQLIAKAPFSSSGKGLLWLPIDGLTRTEEQIIHGVLKKQGTISIEKALDKIVDFAMEFDIKSSSICSFTGYSLFKTNNKGAYEGNFIQSQNQIIELFASYIDINFLDTIKNNLIVFFEQNFRGIYNGCIGVDMMIYKENEAYHLHPCVEINVRDNMGLVAFNIFDKYIDSASEGFFSIDFFKSSEELSINHKEMLQKYPLTTSKGRISSGYLSLCPISETTKYRAYILIN